MSKVLGRHSLATSGTCLPRCPLSVLQFLQARRMASEASRGLDFWWILDVESDLELVWRLFSQGSRRSAPSMTFSDGQDWFPSTGAALDTARLPSFSQRSKRTPSKTKDSISRSLQDEERERERERARERGVHAKHDGIGGNILIDQRNLNRITNSASNKWTFKWLTWTYLFALFPLVLFSLHKARVRTSLRPIMIMI
jgi:hypothetical protein